MLGLGLGLTMIQSRAAGAPPVAVPVVSLPPNVTGFAKVNETFTAEHAAWTNGPIIGRAKQWYQSNDGVTGWAAIPGATGDLYFAAASLAGKFVQVREIATNANGPSAPAASEAIGPLVLAGSVATDLSALGISPAVHYHIPSATITSSDGRITSITDRMGLANASEGSAGVGPLDRTDSQGLRVASFRGEEWMSIADTLVWATRAHTVFMVMRSPWSAPGGGARCFISQGRNANSPPNTGQGPLSTNGSLSLAPHLIVNNQVTRNVANHADLVVGCQIQSIGVASRPTASGAQRAYLNTKTGDVAQNVVNLTGITGGEIGRSAYAPGTTTNWAMMDLYEVIIINSVLTNAQSDAVAAAIVANWDIPAITDQVLLDGDSLTRGIQVTPASAKSIWGYDSLGSVLTDRGSPFCLPRTTRVLNNGIGGHQISNLVSKRDAASSVYAETLPGKNVCMVQIGTNDVNSSGHSAATVYANDVGYWNTSTTGVLQRGWTAVQVLNIARSDNPSTTTILTALRAMYRDPQFLTDTGTDAGGAFPGKMSLLAIPDIDIGGGVTPFLSTATVSANPDMFQGDGLHQSEAAVDLWVSGGVTPANGYRAALTSLGF